jgi:hypothetical protein
MMRVGHARHHDGVRALAVASVLMLIACTGTPAAQTSPTPSAATPQSSVSAPSAAASSTAAASPSAPSPSARVVSEAVAWAEIRATLPAGSPVIPPVWMPAAITRDRVELRELSATTNDPRYAVAYLSPKGTIVFALGAVAGVTGSGYGMRVRGVPATLMFAVSLWTDATKPSPRQVRWVENGRVLSISSETFTGDDLLHIAWSLDPAGAPPPKNPFKRLSEGTCARTGAPAEDTIRALLNLTGTRQADAAADCFADEYLGEYGAVGAIWSELPRSRVDDVRVIGVAGGRPIVQARWAFTSDPGGAWGPAPTRFFMSGFAAGRWRIYSIDSAAIGTMP